MKIVLFVSIILLAVSSLFLWAAARKSVDYRTTAEESEVCDKIGTVFARIAILSGLAVFVSLLWIIIF